MTNQEIFLEFLAQMKMLREELRELKTEVSKLKLRAEIADKQLEAELEDFKREINNE